MKPLLAWGQGPGKSGLSVVWWVLGVPESVVSILEAGVSRDCGLFPLGFPSWCSCQFKPRCFLQLPHVITRQFLGGMTAQVH